MFPLPSSALSHKQPEKKESNPHYISPTSSEQTESTNPPSDIHELLSKEGFISKLIKDSTPHSNSDVVIPYSWAKPEVMRIASIFQTNASLSSLKGMIYDYEGEDKVIYFPCTYSD